MCQPESACFRRDGLLVAHPARSAYGRFMAFSAHTGLIGKDSEGSTVRIRGADASRPRSQRTARHRRPSELDLLRQRQGIIGFYPKVTNGTLDLRASEKQLDNSQIAC